MRKLIPFIRSVLSESYTDSAETDTVCKALCCELLGVSEYAYYLKEPVLLTPEMQEKLGRALQRLQAGEPLQYVLGGAQFDGITLHVDRSVLIPRPETAELARQIGKEGFPGVEEPIIVDIGTGSGCIAISLKRSLPHAKVFATDVSEAALRTAARNAAEQEVDIVFIRHDMLSEILPASVPPAHCLISNPPYVRQCERRFMEARVTDWEPPTALFVPDSDPLLFFRALAQLGKTSSLLPGGIIVAEASDAFAHEVCTLFRLYGYVEVSLTPDLFGMPRYVRCRKSDNQVIR